MKKNRLIGIGLILFVLIVPLNIGFLEIDMSHGTLSLIMMILVEVLVLGALIIGVNKD